MSKNKTKADLVVDLEEAQHRIAELEARTTDESENRFASVFRASPSQMALTDLSTHLYVEVNEAFLHTLGFTREEVLGKTALDLNLFANPAQRTELLQRLEAQGYLRDEHVLVRTKAGALRQGIFAAEYVHGNGQEYLLTVMNDITEKVQAEARWQFALEGAGDGIWDWNAQTNQVFFSHQWKSMLGYEEEEIGTTLDEWKTRVHPDDLAAVMEKINEHAAGGSPFYSSEHRVRCKDGSYKWILDSGKVIDWTEDHNPLRVIGTYKDISERKAAEEKLRRSEEHFARAFAANPASQLIVSQEDGRILDANAAFCQQTGFTRTELIGRQTRELNIWMDPAQQQKMLQQLQAEGHVHAVEIDFRNKTGEVHTVLFSFDSIELNGNRCIVSTGMDITERKRAEQALQSAELKYRVLVEQSPAIVYEDEVGGHWKYLSPQLETITGYKPEEFIRQRGLWKSIIYPEDLPRLEQETQIGIENGSRITVEYRIITRDNQIIWLHDVSDPFPDPQTGRVILRGIFYDITERKRADALVATQRDLARLTSLNLAKEETWQACFEAVLRVSDLDSGGLYLLNEKSRTFELVYHVGLSRNFIDLIQRFGEQTPVAQKILSGQHYYFNESDLSAQKHNVDEGLRSLVVLPIQHHGQIIGCLNIASHTLVRIPDHSRTALESVAAEVSNIVLHQLTDEALQVSRNQLSQVLLTARMGIWNLNLSTNQMKISPEFAQLVSEATSSVSLDAVLKNIHPEDRERTGHAIQEAIARRQSFTVEYRIFDTRGNMLWVSNYGNVECDPEGNIIGITGLLHDITERKQAEEKLRKSEALLNEAQRVGRIGYLEWNALDKHLTISKELYDMFELPQDGSPITQHSIEALLSTEDRKRLRELDRQLFASHSNLDYEYQINLPSGKARWVHQFTQVTYDGASGSPNYMIGIAQDITERKRAEAARLEGEEQYHLLFDNLLQGIVFQDETGRIFQANPAAERILGLTLDQMLGRASIDPHWRAIHEDGSDFPGETHPAMLALQTGKPVQNVVMGVFSPVTEAHRWINISAVPRFRNGEEKPYQVYTTFDDITERKQAEVALQDSELRYRTMLEQSSDALFVHDVYGQHIEVNKLAYESLGYTHAELLQMNVMDIEVDLDRETVQAHWQQIEPGSTSTLLGHQRRKNGTLLPVEVRVGCILWHEQKLFIATARDITERLEAEAKLRESEARAQAMLKAIPDLMFRLNREGVFLDYKADVSELYAQSEPTILGQRNQDISTPEFGDLIDQKINETLESGKLLNFEYQMEIPRSGLHTYEARMTPSGSDEVIAVVRDISERKQAEEKLRESEERFQQIADNIDEVFWMFDNREQKLVYLNAAYEKIWKRSIELTFSDARQYIEAIHPEDRDIMYEALAQQASGKPSAMEYRIMHDDGAVRWIADHSFPIFDSAGKLIRTTGIATDITERKQAENELRLTEQRYRALIENAPDGIVLIGLDGHFKYASPSVERIFGYTYDEALAGDPNAFTHPEDLPMVLAELMKLIEDPAHTPTLQYRFRHKNGNWRWIESTFSNLSAVPGVEAIIINFRDIHARKLAEEALRESNEVAQAILNASTESVFLMDLDGKVIAANQTTAKRLGATVADLIGANIYDFIPAQTGKNRKKQIGEVISNRKPIIFEDERLGMWLENSIYPIIDNDGEIRRVAVYGRDITERKHAEQALHDSQLRMEMALKGANAATWEWSVQTGEAVFNERWAEIVGYTLQELEPVSIQTWSELCHPADLQTSNALLQKHFAGETEFYECEVRMKHKNGSWIWVIDRGKVMEWDADGSPIRMFGTHLDITERKREERYTQARLRLANLSYAILDMDTLMRTMLDEAEALTDSQIGFFHFVDNDQNTISLQAWSTNTINTMCKAEGKGQHYPVAQAGVWADGIRDGEPRIYNHYATLPNRRGLPTGHAPIARLISLPITRNNQIVATIGVGNKLQAYDEHDLDVLKQIAEYAFDIVLRKRAETALRASEEKYRGLLESLDSVVATVDKDGKFLYVNDMAAEQMGSTVTKLTGKTMYEIFPEQVAAQQMTSIQNVINTNQGKVSEAISFVEGQPRWYRTSLQPLHDEAGQVVSVMLNSTDIHTLKTTQQELEKLNHTLEERVKERTAQVQDLYDNAPVGYHSINIHRQLTAINQTELDMLGYTKEELLGQHTSHIFMPESAQILAENFQKFIATGKTVDMEVEARRKDGTHFPVLINAVAIFNDAGQFTSSRSTMVDITRRKEAELSLRNAILELERAMRVKDEFLANMSHELRTPLNAIIGLSESLTDEIAGDLNTKQQKYVSTIRESGQHLLSMINDILDLAKIEAGQVELDRSRVNISAVCETSLRMVKQLAHKKNLIVEFKLDEQLDTVEADERRLKQMLVNLLTNAVKFTPEKGHIGLEVQGDPEKQQIHFTVWDDGIGIKPEDQARLFKPFVQVNNTLTNTLGGTGLGLALVTQLAHLHQGNVTLKSEYGVGSRFTITLPWDGVQSKVPMPSDVNQMRNTMAKNSEAARRTILLVEDTETAIMVISDYLEFAGYKVTVAHNGKEGIDLANQVKPDLILMDIQMPGMDGMNATGALRSQPEFAATPIIALTAFAMAGDRERFLAIGFTDYLSKPVNLKALVQLIQTYTKNKDAL